MKPVMLIVMFFQRPKHVLISTTVNNRAGSFGVLSPISIYITNGETLEGNEASPVFQGVAIIPLHLVDLASANDLEDTNRSKVYVLYTAKPRKSMNPKDAIV
jgi:hypothetical protein